MIIIINPLVPQLWNIFMIKKKLGKTNIHTTSLGFGGAPMGDLFEKLKEEDCFNTLKISYECGINIFDTSPLLTLAGTTIALMSVVKSYYTLRETNSACDDFTEIYLNLKRKINKTY